MGNCTECNYTNTTNSYNQQPLKIIQANEVNVDTVNIIKSDENNEKKQIDLTSKLTNEEDLKQLLLKKKYPNLEYLNLSRNNLTDLSFLKDLKAPKLKKLDLSFNKIERLDVFMELNFPLEELYIQENDLHYYTALIEAPILQKLKKLKFSVNSNNNNENDGNKPDSKDYEFEDTNDNKILEQITKALGTKEI